MIAICPNPFRDSGLTVTRRIEALLRSNGEETAICPVFAESEPEVLPEDIQAVTLDKIAPDCRLAVVVGGDGTLLAVARQLFNANVPVLGVNLGTKGFMCALEQENIDLVAKAARGEMGLSRRMLLDVSILREGETVFSDCALNDAVIHGYGDCVKLTARSGGDIITSYSGDGIIISTPTGSTGYSMSAGGPIVEPDAENIIISPICAHMMGARSFVLGPERTVTVSAEKLHGRRAYLSVDGNWSYELKNGDVLRARRSENRTLMADMGLKTFFEMAYSKLT